jgi:ASC-1-like (ASCH) protein
VTPTYIFIYIHSGDIIIFDKMHINFMAVFVEQSSTFKHCPLTKPLKIFDLKTESLKIALK